MGLFRRNNYEEQRKRALLASDCEESVGIILDFIKELEALQSIMDQNRYEEGVWMAQRCCSNPIIACDTYELPTVGLRTVQDMILNEIAQLDSAFYDDAQQGIFNIAADGNCSEVVDICRYAINQLRAALR